jgi:hypothetical protein
VVVKILTTKNLVVKKTGSFLFEKEEEAPEVVVVVL